MTFRDDRDPADELLDSLLAEAASDPAVTEHDTVVIALDASPGERYAPGAFDRTVGKRVPVRIGEQTSGTGVVTQARVAEDGASVQLTVALNAGHALLPGLPPMSLGTAAD